jgi:hypothetical protein
MRRALVLTLMMAGLAAPALAAGDRIAPGRAIGPVGVGDERATIAARLGGDGVVIRRTRNAAAPGNRNLDRVVVAYPALALTARFPTDEASTQATAVATRSPRYRTGGGVGVGSTRAALLGAHPRTVCGGAICVLRRPAGLTRFHLAGGRVARVAVSRYPLSLG